MAKRQRKHGAPLLLLPVLILALQHIFNFRLSAISLYGGSGGLTQATEDGTRVGSSGGLRPSPNVTNGGNETKAPNEKLNVNSTGIQRSDGLLSQGGGTSEQSLEKSDENQKMVDSQSRSNPDAVGETSVASGGSSPHVVTPKKGDNQSDVNSAMKDKVREEGKIDAHQANQMIAEASNSSTPPAVPDSDFDPSLNTSGCLLTKDDLTLVPEWIAYHYHALQMRYLIIIQDVTSLSNTTSGVLERFRRELPDLEIASIQDKDFMPAWFVIDKNYTHVHHYDKSSQIPDPQKRRKSQLYDIHLFRQRWFVPFCAKTVRERQKRMELERMQRFNLTEADVKKPQPNWLMLTDTDEFIVPNSKWRSDPNISSFLPDSVPREATAGSVVRYIRDVHVHFPASGHPQPRPSNVCMVMPMVEFGGLTNETITPEKMASMERFDSPRWIDVPDVPAPFNSSRFETTAFRFHQNLTGRMQQLGQKALIDVDIHGPLPQNAEILTKSPIGLIHHPSLPHCRRQPAIARLDVHRDPLMLNHYRGTFERFAFRADQTRNEQNYKRQAYQASQYDDGWITTWVKHFVAVHGIDKAQRVLGSHFLLGNDNLITIEKRRIEEKANT